MALKANLKGAKSARDSFGPLYNRIVAGKFGGGDDVSASASPAKGSPLKRKGLLEGGGVDDGEGEGEDEVASPLKKTKKAATPSSRKGKAKKGKKVEEVDDVNDGEEADDDTIVVKAEVLEDDAGQQD